MAIRRRNKKCVTLRSSRRPQPSYNSDVVAIENSFCVPPFREMGGSNTARWESNPSRWGASERGQSSMTHPSEPDSTPWLNRKLNYFGRQIGGRGKADLPSIPKDSRLCRELNRIIKSIPVDKTNRISRASDSSLAELNQKLEKSKDSNRYRMQSDVDQKNVAQENPNDPETLKTGQNSNQDVEPHSVDFLMRDFIYPPSDSMVPEDYTWDFEIKPTPLSKESLLAKYITVIILGVSILGIGTFLTYYKLVIPAPARLGATQVELELPKPIFVASKKPVQTLRSDHQQELETSVIADLSDPNTIQTAHFLHSQEKRLTSLYTQPSKIGNTAPPLLSVARSDDSKGKLPTGKVNKDNLLEAPTLLSENLSKVATSKELISEGSTLNSGVDLKNEYQSVMEEAIALHKRGQRKGAAKAYRRALELDPNGSEALSKLAFYSLNAGAHREALRLAQRAVDIDPKSSEAWIVLGAARQASRDRDGAKTAYKKCTQANGRYVAECRRLLR